MGLYYYNKFLGENDPRLDFNQWVSLPWLCLSFMQSLCILVRTQKTDVFLLSARNLPELATFGVLWELDRLVCVKVRGVRGAFEFCRAHKASVNRKHKDALTC